MKCLFLLFFSLFSSCCLAGDSISFFDIDERGYTIIIDKIVNYLGKSHCKIESIPSNRSEFIGINDSSIAEGIRSYCILPDYPNLDSGEISKAFNALKSDAQFINAYINHIKNKSKYGIKVKHTKESDGSTEISDSDLFVTGRNNCDCPLEM